MEGSLSGPVCCSEDDLVPSGTVAPLVKQGIKTFGFPPCAGDFEESSRQSGFVLCWILPDNRPNFVVGYTDFSHLWKAHNLSMH